MNLITHLKNLITHLNRYILRLRIGLCALAIDLEEAAAKRSAARLEKLARREIDLRIRYSRITPLRHLISYPQ